jgi:thymidine kinase
MGEIIDDSWILLFSGTNTNIIYSNKEFKDSKKNLKLFKDIKERLPKFLIQFVSSHKDKDNEEYKLVHNRNNTLKAMAAANSDDAADKLGRGMTTSNIYFDEFAFLARNKIIFEAALPA